MTHGFHRSRKGIVADLGDPEREVLLSLLQQTLSLLESYGGPVNDAGGSGQEEDGDSFEAMMRRAGFPESTDTSGERATGSEAGAEFDDPGSTDPALRRLLPDGHRDDPEAAAEFRRLTGTSVRDRKIGHVRRAATLVASAHGGRFRLQEEEAVSLLIAMTDVRLVLADRLGLDDDEAAESLSDQVMQMDPDDPRFALALGYEFLTWLQETLAVALTP
ncbi:DUF2017 family protein [Mobilicoccus caccae]|uniref:DUF2017 domain-containing protein n=1 Tax=Mobilicoccus caccae TaxID=1859295 RepID=A0ABQ6IPM6_9MICO|nr:DUF2017 family protein [Mobilicoccus caccae]GMA39046.1 hypothetical protein GCM10025883_10910 [Mobilicoccus caccae]